MKRVTPKQLFFISAFLLFACHILEGQKAPVRFGKIDIEDLEMTVYPLDSTAEAVILCDYGYLDPERMQFTRVKRIKILKKEGTWLASMVLPVTHTSLVRGRTYNLVDGEVVSSKLKSESIFKEQVTDYWYNVRISMPDVKVGSIVEVGYSRRGVPSEWRFQDEIPIRWSEIRLPEHHFYSLQKNFTGYHPLKIRETWRWAAENVPAFRAEPYVNSSSNYIRKLEMELASITIPGVVYEDFTSSWSAVNKYFDEHNRFGEMTTGIFPYLSKDVDRIESSCNNDWEKIVAAVETIRKEVQWDERNWIYPVTSLAYTYNNKKIGSSADVNFLLLQLLKKLDIEVYPVILSTRSNGKIYEYFPTVDRFNYIIVCAKSGEQLYFLDATDRFCPPGQLPEKCLNGKGFLIRRGAGQWIDLPVGAASSDLVFCDMHIDGSGTLNGSVRWERIGYAASRFRRKFDAFNSTEEYVDDLEQANGGCVVSDYKLENRDSLFKPVKETFNVEITDRAMQMGDMIYLDPSLFDKIEENPFKLEDREYPVDFTYPFKKVYIAKFTIPEGYTVEELPTPVRITTQNKSASMVYQATQMGPVIQLMYTLSITKPIFYQAEYKELKELFNQVVMKQAESIILKAESDEG